MKIIVKQTVFFIIWVFASNALFAFNNQKIIKDCISDTRFFPVVAIHAINSVRADTGELISKKIQMQSVTYKSNLAKSRIIREIHPVNPQLGKVLWTITAEQLPVTESSCLDADALLCKERAQDDDLTASLCHNLCVFYGPEFLAFDAKSGKLYFEAMTSPYCGTGGCVFLSFVADIYKKEIKPFKLIDGPASAYLSPSGNYLALVSSSNNISVFDINSGKSLSIYKNNLKNKRLHFLSKIRWLNDTQIKYLDKEYQGKFQDSADLVTEKIFDINTKKLISSRQVSS